MRTFWVASSFAQGDRQQFVYGPVWQFEEELMAFDGIVYEADATGKTVPVVDEVVQFAGSMSRGMFEKVAAEIQELRLAQAIGKSTPGWLVQLERLQRIYMAAPFPQEHGFKFSSEVEIEPSSDATDLMTEGGC
jgi:hypothetical protein